MPGAGRKRMSRVGRQARIIRCQCPQCDTIYQKGKNVPCSAMHCERCGVSLHEVEGS